MRTKLILAAGVALALTGPVQAQGDPAAGADKAQTCLGCHGVAGYRNAYPSYRVPKLGGQHAQYLESALKAYKNGARQHMTMQAQAMSLTEQDIQDIAAYFAQVGGE
ncbi:c-type cytochrome [Arhodomonas sp. SL1]|uniref:c-type cytochrome n=1 Tax=Arhodomonas sp. SL1 TaxID=3425691 RepID=UPI003F880A0C